MTEITLIRHGQAITGARSEADYDRLSDLGRRQAEWLGAYFSGIGGFDRVISGTLRRQEETARAINLDGRPHRRDARLNELDYFRLSQVLEARDGIPFPTDPMSFAAHVPQVLELWRAGHAGPGHESYEVFRERVLGAVADAAAGDRARCSSPRPASSPRFARWRWGWRRWSRRGCSSGCSTPPSTASRSTPRGCT
jgi:broad specificity phosphatase PhoE